MRLSSQFIIQFCGGIANAILFFSLTPVLISSLGLERYGVLLLILQFTIYVGLVEFGLGLATSREIAARDPSQRGQVFCASLLLASAFGCAAGVLYALLSLSIIGQALGIAPELAEELNHSGWALFLIGFVGVAQSVVQGALHGMSRFVELNILAVLASAFTIMSPAAYAIIVGGDITGLLTSVGLGSALSTIFGLALCWRAGILSLRPNDERIAARLLSYGGWATISGLLHRATNSIDRIIVGAMVGSASVAIFAIPQAALMRTQIFGTALMSAAFPRLARSNVDSSLARDCYRCVLLLSPMFVVGIFGMPPLLALWLGYEFAEVASATAILLAIWAWLELINVVPLFIMQAKSRVREESAVATAITLPNIILLIGAIYFFGVEGAALVAIIRSLAYLVPRIIIAGLRSAPVFDLVLNGSIVIFAGILALTLHGWIAITAGLLLAMISTGIVVARRPPVVDEFLLRSHRWMFDRHHKKG